MEDFIDDDKIIEYPHFYEKGSMDKQWDYLNEREDDPDLKPVLKEELLDLPLINFLDPNSIRSVGAFNRCVFQFGKNQTKSFQIIYTSCLISIFFGILFLLILYFNVGGDKIPLGLYILCVFVPANLLPIFFWIFMYFYYGACVNSSFGIISDMLNEVGNILDSIKT